MAAARARMVSLSALEGMAAGGVRPRLDMAGEPDVGGELGEIIFRMVSEMRKEGRERFS